MPPTPYAQASIAVDACLSLKDELAAATLREPTLPGAPPLRVLFAIDDYSTLHWRTGYGRDDGEGRRIPLVVDDLTLVRVRVRGAD